MQVDVYQEEVTDQKADGQQRKQPQNGGLLKITGKCPEKGFKDRLVVIRQHILCDFMAGSQSGACGNDRKAANRSKKTDDGQICDSFQKTHQGTVCIK